MKNRQDNGQKKNRQSNGQHKDRQNNGQKKKTKQWPKEEQTLLAKIRTDNTMAKR
jgi:hypothetical protein